MSDRTPAVLPCRHAWGKLNWSAAGKLTSLSLAGHCMDVAAVAVTLLRLPTWRRRFERLAGRTLTDTDIARLGVLAFLHDVGKAGVGFWLKQLDTPNPDGSRCAKARTDALKTLGGKPNECGHTHEVMALLSCPEAWRAAKLPVAEIRHWCGPRMYLWFASISHHGRPITLREKHAPRGWMWDPAHRFDYDPIAELRVLSRQVRTMFPEAFVSAPPLPTSNSFIHAFAGLVSLADWIASNPDPEFFPYDLAPEATRWPCALERAAQVLKSMQLDPEDARASLRERAPSFSAVFFDHSNAEPFAPTRLQQAMERTDLGQLWIAEDETGAGKTEAALWRFKVLFEAGKVDALAFVLPTRVAAVAICERIRRFIARLFPDAKRRPNVILAVPGYLKAAGHENRQIPPGELPLQDVLWPDDIDDATSHRRWASERPKRYLAAAVAVGTIDQVLLSALQTSHSHLRAVSLLRSLLVVDEVHSSDTYMTRLLETVLDRHIRAGGHALLLSATLGGETRERFLRPPVPGEVFEAPNADALLETPYPLLSGSCGAVDLSGSAQVCRQKVVHIDTSPLMRDAEAIARRAAELVTHGAKVLVVRNTVDGAVAVQTALTRQLGEDHPALFRLGGVACPHHGRFAPEDRRRLDEAVSRQFGKGSPAEARVLVGTQTLEQSLDICADYLITDLCPVDVLLQRIGRLHRHQRLRPQGFEQARVLVLCPPERDLSAFLSDGGPARHGLGRVYANLLSIDATWEALIEQPVWTLPRDNRRLVERCTNTQRLSKRAQRLGTEWVKHWSSQLGKAVAQRGEASVRRLDWEGNFDPFSDNLQARSRLGEMRRLLKLPAPAFSPFPDEQGQLLALTELQIPEFLWPKGCELEQAEHVEPLGRGFHFTLVSQAYRYDHCGLAKLMRVGS